MRGDESLSKGHLGRDRGKAITAQTFLFSLACAERVTRPDKVSNYCICLKKLRKGGHLSLCICLCVLEEFSKIVLDAVRYNPSEQGSSVLRASLLRYFLSCLLQATASKPLKVPNRF